MWILPLIGYLGLLLGFAFLTLAIASGLYYLSELVEEHTRLTHLILTRLIYALLTLHLLLYLIDSFPIHLTFLSIASHLLYSLNLRRFPTVNLLSPIFLLSCVLVLVNHYAYFRHFSTGPSRGRIPPPMATRGGRRMAAYAGGGAGAYGELADVPSFTEAAAFFGVMVWLVPFTLFVSLSAGDNVLPSMGSEGVTGVGGGVSSATAVGEARTGGGGMAKQVVDRVREAVGGWAGWGRRNDGDGLGPGIGMGMASSGRGSSGGYGLERPY